MCTKFHCHTISSLENTRVGPDKIGLSTACSRHCHYHFYKGIKLKSFSHILLYDVFLLIFKTKFFFLISKITSKTFSWEIFLRLLHCFITFLWQFLKFMTLYDLWQVGVLNGLVRVRYNIWSFPRFYFALCIWEDPYSVQDGDDDNEGRYILQRSFYTHIWRNNTI